MAILQNHPGAIFHTLVDETYGDHTLPLTQRQRKQSTTSEPLIVSEFQQNCHRIGAGSQNEYQRYATVRIAVRRSQIESWRFDEFSSQFVFDEKKNDTYHSTVRVRTKYLL